MEYDRKIIHIDMDAFFASVEQRDNPTLKGKPVAVGGSPEGRGVVAAASYEARKFGVRSAMSAARAKRLCPQLVFVCSHFEKYKEVSRKIHQIFREVTEIVEPLSLDEAYLDVTQNKLNETSATKLAVYLKSRIKGQTGLTASAGVAPNKFLAKVASDFDKPNGLVVVPPEKIRAFVQCLPVEKLWGVGPATAKRLHALGISNTEDLRKASPALLSKQLGKLAPFLIELSHGIDHRSVSTKRIRKSRGAERTFAKDILDLAELETWVERLSENIAEVIPKMKTKARTVTLKVRYSDFTTLTRSETPETPIWNGQTLSRIAIGLLRKTKAGQRPIRLVGVSLSNFDEKEETDKRQLNLDF